MKEFLSLLNLILAFVVLCLVIARTFHLAVLPGYLNDLINYYLGYVMAHFIIGWRARRAERRKGLAQINQNLAPMPAIPAMQDRRNTVLGDEEYLRDLRTGFVRMQTSM